MFEGLRFNREQNNNDGILSALNSIAELNLKQNNIRTAENQLFEARQLAQNANDKLQVLKFYRLQKELDSTKGAYQSAFQWQTRYYKLKSELENRITSYNVCYTKLLRADVP